MDVMVDEVMRGGGDAEGGEEEMEKKAMMA